MKRNLFLIVSALIVFLFASCEKEDPEMQDFYLVSLRGEVNDWDLLAFDKDGGSLLIKTTLGGTRPTHVYYVPEKGRDGYPIYLNNEGFPEMVVVSDHIFVFSKVDDLKIDVSMVTPSGEVITTRNLATGLDWSDLLKSSQTDFSPGTIARWAARVASATGCALKAKADAKTGGVSLPSITWGCGSDIISAASKAVDAEAISLSSDKLNKGVSALGCSGEPSTCIQTLATTQSGIINQANTFATQKKLLVDAAKGVLLGKYGDVQVTLVWNNIADLDLHVIDPAGFEIYFAAKVSHSGGTLDIDNVYAYGPENIFWPLTTAPNGTYKVYVRHYAGAEASDYIAVVHSFGKFKTFSGRVEKNQMMHVTDFSHTGFVTKSLEAPVMFTDNPAK
jgi:hypothetical protein